MIDPVGVRGAVDKVFVDEYAGDGTNNREIDFGDYYDECWIRAADARSGNADHLGEAHATRASGRYQVLYRITSWMSASGSSADARWQGFLAGTTRIALGSNGADAGGTNVAGRAYEVVALKYRRILA